MQFRCVNCNQIVSEEGGNTSHRNHCPFCGYSLHVDETKGDRKAECNSKMKPIALAFKSKGELCFVHKCLGCGKINYNRIAADDSSEMITDVFNSSLDLDKNTLSSLEVNGTEILVKEDTDELKKQLYGIK
jgi:DNA-directed RNA polymerase subunit RPC12/RpoP